MVTGTLPSGRRISVVDTPGILNTEGKNVSSEIRKAVDALKPGPNAFLIVLKPGRATDEEKGVIRTLRQIFQKESYFDHTILIMTRKADIEDDNDDHIPIHQYMREDVSDDLKKLYKQCGKRIVAVENLSNSRDQYAQEISNEIESLGGYYDREFYELEKENRKKRKAEIKQNEEEIERIRQKQTSGLCVII
ncbi:GTPase IMAP family member 6-like [Mytilus californianus]|uniref:GTPase IMAP family member 6-like n=1 Tax=Mytilus californianus TaxID=6549 RepID=UPI0022485F9F|nr:GTPase IMAP family member 6-like [Mytilus californianus]